MVTRLRNVVATGILILAVLAGFAVYQVTEGQDDGVRLVATWDGIKPDHIVFDVAGVTHVVDPVPGKQNDTWRFNAPYVPGASYGIGVYLNYAAGASGRTHNYTCSVYVHGVLEDHGYHDQVGSIRCQYPKER